MFNFIWKVPNFVEHIDYPKSFKILLTCLFMSVYLVIWLEILIHLKSELFTSRWTFPNSFLISADEQPIHQIFPLESLWQDFQSKKKNKPLRFLEAYVIFRELSFYCFLKCYMYQRDRGALCLSCPVCPVSLICLRFNWILICQIFLIFSPLVLYFSFYLNS